MVLSDFGVIQTIDEFIKDEHIHHELAVKYLDGRKSSTIKFKHCSECGEKLDWKYLKKMLLSAKALTAPTPKFPSTIGAYATRVANVLSPASNWFIMDSLSTSWKLPSNKQTYLQAKRAKRGNK